MEESKDTMWAVVMDAPGIENITVRRVPIPQPKSGQLLVRVEAAPINPSDLGGMINQEMEFPFVPGNEGAGIVVRSGGGLLARGFVNKRVAFTRFTGGGAKKQGGMNGTYAEYIVVDAKTTLTISDNKIDLDYACNSFVNPATAIGLLDTLKSQKARFVVQTGAASQLARMMLRMAKDYNITFINIVRREEQVKLLKEEYKQEFVLNSSDDNFFDQLKEVATEYNAKHCIECVGGAMTGRIMSRLPDGSHTYVYGCLSLEALQAIDPRKFIYQGHRMEGWILTKWIASKNIFQKIWLMRKINKLLGTTLSSVVAARYGIHETKEAIKYYQENMTEGKVILKPGLVPSDYSASS